MSFFLPRRLIEFEYFGDGEEAPEYQQIAEPYRNDMDFAFFAVNFGYSKADYDALTLREKAFIYKAWETREISLIMSVYNAAFAAFYNVNRKKGKRALEPLKRRKSKKADMETVSANLKIAKQVATKEGTAWADKIYRANGLKPPERRLNA